MQYWREGSEYDMGVAEALLEKGKCPYALFTGKTSQGIGGEGYAGTCPVYSFFDFAGKDGEH